MTIKFKKLSEDAIIPQYQTKGSAGFDLHAIGDFIVTEGSIFLVKTGLSIEIPEGYELQIRSRSGLALKQGLIVLNAPGTVDSDYRGEIGVIMQYVKYKDDPDVSYCANIKKGDRIAQGVIAKIEQPMILLVGEGEELSSTERGSGGFGSTGL